MNTANIRFNFAALSSESGVKAGFSERRITSLMLAFSGAALSLVWIMLLPTWIEVFSHVRAGAGLQILILASAAAIGGAAWQCCYLARKSILGAKESDLRITSGVGGTGPVLACRSVHGWTVGKSRANAPAACQREQMSVHLR